jgi:hypothetical protein
MATIRSIAALAVSLSLAACGPGSGDATPPGSAPGPTRSIDVTSAAQQVPAAPTAVPAWTWTTDAVEGTISAIAPAPGGGGVALLSQWTAQGPGELLALGFFDAGGALVAVRSLAVGSLVELARPGIAVTPDGWAVLALNLDCEAGCPDFGGAPLASGPYLLALSAGGGLALFPLGEGEVQSLAVNAAGQVAVALAGPEDASVLVLDLAEGVVLDVFMERIGGAMRIAFTGEGDLVVGRDSVLHVFAPDGRRLAEIDAGHGLVIDAVAAAGDTIGVAGTAPGAGGVVAALDSSGSVRWARGGAGANPAIAVDATGALAVNVGTDVWKLDASGATVSQWPGPQPAVFPPGVDVDAVAFVGGQLVAGGVLDGERPFLVALSDPAPAM